MTVRAILAAVDFGDASTQALRAAGLVAQRTGAALQVLHAELPEAPAYFTHEQVDALAAQRERMEAQARAFVTAFVRKHTAAPFAVVLEAQPPADAIVRHLSGVDLGVMGTHGRQGPRRWWLGSVAERVLQSADRPLLILHAGNDPTRMFERVAVFSAPGREGARAFALASTLAGAFDGSVIDRRGGRVEPSALHHGATLVVVSAPVPHERHWLSTIGETLVRAAAGPVLFVPEMDPSGGHHDR